VHVDFFAACDLPRVLARAGHQSGGDHRRPHGPGRQGPQPAGDRCRWAIRIMPTPTLRVRVLPELRCVVCADTCQFRFLSAVSCRPVPRRFPRRSNAACRHAAVSLSLACDMFLHLNSHLVSIVLVFCHLCLLSNWLGATVLRISCVWILAYARTPRTPGYRPSGSIREIGVRAKGETAWRPVNGAPPSTVRIFPSDA